jgi:hypothetical protein
LRIFKRSQKQITMWKRIEKLIRIDLLIQEVFKVFEWSNKIEKVLLLLVIILIRKLSLIKRFNSQYKTVSLCKLFRLLSVNMKGILRMGKLTVLVLFLISKVRNSMKASLN